jgi:hypothetical protein
MASRDLFMDHSHEFKMLEQQISEAGKTDF